jgi:hypothetical protein
MLKEKKKYGAKEFALGISVCLGLLALVIFLPFFIGRSGITYPQPHCWDDSGWYDVKTHQIVPPNHQECDPVTSEAMMWYYAGSWFRGFIILIMILSFCKGIQLFVDDIKHGRDSWMHQNMKKACKAVYSFFTMIGIRISERFRR